MTRIEFFFNVEDKTQKVADLAQRITAKGRQLYIFAPDTIFASQLDAYLWTYQASSFLPHGLDAEHDEIVLIATEESKLQHDDVMINFATQVPVFFSRFLRLIEIVGLDEVDKVAARKRFRLYREQGYDIKSFDAAGFAIQSKQF